MSDEPVRRIGAPPLPSRFVSRPRIPYLIGSLIEDYPVVCVYATAGAGKTTAVAQAATESSRPVAWVTMEATNAAPGRLLTQLEAALALHVEDCAGVASKALAAHLPHSEAAGLLAEAVGSARLLVVLDQLEYLAGAPEAIRVVEAFLRFAPAGLHAALISRREIDIDLRRGAGPGRIAGIGEADLAFTVDEAAEALAQVGASGIDPAEAVEATGGWVTGILFEAWRSTDHVAGAGGEGDPLQGYLSDQILATLPDEDREFLVTTSILPYVTASAAGALGSRRPGERLASLRTAHLPVTWDPGAHVMTCHPRFREYLSRRLADRGAAVVGQLRRAYAGLLLEEGHHEEAVEEFLKIPAPAEAVPAAEAAIGAVMDRFDLAIAERWLKALAGHGDPTLPGLATARLMLAIARENYGAGVDFADALLSVGRRDRLATTAARAATLMAWCYLHAGRVADMRAVIEAAPDDPAVEPMRYCLALTDGRKPEVVPPLSGGPLDALIVRVHYYLGALPLLAELPESQWAARASESWRVGALRALGRTDEAVTLYETMAARGGGLWHNAILSVELMHDLGRRESAWRELAKGRELIRASGSIMLEHISFVLEAAMEIRFNRDAASARAALERFERDPAAAAYVFISVQAEMWFGASYLIEDRNTEAADRLRRAVTTMVGADQLLGLPTAAVYLAEAEHRLGNDDAAARAAALAIESADRQGSTHTLLQALSDFPGVAARRLSDGGGETWQALGRLLVARGVALETPVATDVVVREFGAAAITVDGREATPRLTKAFELLAFLAARPKGEATKGALLEALFESRSDESARAYLRQALHKLRAVLPAGAVVSSTDDRVALSPDVRVSSESSRVEDLISESAAKAPRERLAVLLEALELVDGGEYLPGVTSTWAEDRREYLHNLAQDARMTAAELAFATGSLRDAERLVETVVREDPFREATWRLAMRVASVLGDEDRVIARFRSCERALREIGAEPSETTRRLLEALRR
jgi:DNA-binding SARP family transcriptional activator